MKKIKSEEVAFYKKKAEEILKGAKRVTAKHAKQLSELGFTLERLGTGRSAYITSTVVAELNINSKYYLNGKFLAVGVANVRNGKVQIYRAYIMQIVD